MTDLYDVTSLTVAEEQAESTVRRECIDGRWYFSVIDMIGFLTDSPNPRRYWTDLKRDLAAEGAVKCTPRAYS
jgi:hypothetical protein